MKKELTQKQKLQKLKDGGFVDKSVKTFNKSVKTAWTEFNAAFKTGNVFRNAALLKGSKGALSAARSVNMLVVGDRIVFPAGNTKVKIYEKGNRITIIQTKASGHRDVIVLAKDGNHIPEGIKYAQNFRNKKGKKHSFGTLKTHDLETTKGEFVKGFMRDVSKTYENPIDALTDERYVIEKVGLDPAEYYKDPAKFISAAYANNGVSALILTEY